MVKANFIDTDDALEMHKEKEKLSKEGMLLTEEELAAEYTITGKSLVSLLVKCLVSFFASILEGRANVENKEEIYDIWSRYIREELKITDLTKTE